MSFGKSCRSGGNCAWVVALAGLILAIGTEQAGGVPMKLTTNPGQDIHPTWDPDSETIVYMRSAAGSGSGVPYNLYQVQADGTGEGPFATGPGSPWGVGQWPAWLGDRVLTEERNVFHEYLSFTAASAPFNRVISDGSDAAFTRELVIPGGGGGGWITGSRDGSTVMWRNSSSGGAGTQQVRTAPFSSLTGQSANAIGSVRLSTVSGTQHRLTEPAALTPDGSQYFIAMPAAGANGDSTQPWDLWRGNTDGSGSLVNVTNLAGTGVWSRAPAVSPDGTQVLFSRWSGVPGEMWDLYLMDLDGGDVQQITDTPDLGEFRATWSPDGTRAAFTADGDIWVTVVPEPAAALLLGPLAMLMLAGRRRSKTR